MWQDIDWAVVECRIPPSKRPLASSEYSTPPSPLQAGAPAWLTPGPLRGPLHHQGLSTGTSRGLCRSGLLRGRRSRPGHVHAGAPSRRGQSPAAPNCPAAVWTGRGSRALRGGGPAGPGGAARSKNARVWSEGSPDLRAHPLSANVLRACAGLPIRPSCRDFQMRENRI